MSTCGDCEYYDAGKMGCSGSCLTLAERILSETGVRTCGAVPVRADSPACSDFEQSSEAEAWELLQADDEPVRYPHDPFAARPRPGDAVEFHGRRI